MLILSLQTQQNLPEADTAALAAAVKVSGDNESEGQASALLPSADRKNVTWSISFSATSVAYALASSENPTEATAPDELAVKLLFAPATSHMLHQAMEACNESM